MDIVFAVDASVVSSFLGASIFVLAIVLGGVMQDYKESEKIPSEIESQFQFLLTHLQYMMADTEAKALPYRPAENPAHRCAIVLHQLLEVVALYLDQAETPVEGKLRTMDYDTALALFRRLDARFQAELARTDPKYFFPPVIAAMSLIRARLSRIHVIRETSFILLGYSLFDTLVAFILCLLVTTKYNAQSGLLVSGFFSYLFFYMGLLVRSLDDPFDYPKNTNTNFTMLRTGEPAAQVVCEVPCDVLFVNFAQQLLPFLPAEYLKSYAALPKGEGSDVAASLAAVEGASAAAALKARTAAEAEKAAAAAVAAATAAASHPLQHPQQLHHQPFVSQRGLTGEAQKAPAMAWAQQGGGAGGGAGQVTVRPTSRFPPGEIGDPLL